MTDEAIRAHHARINARCVVCGIRLMPPSTHPTVLAKANADSRSKAVGKTDQCVHCASPSRLAEATRPRYCECSPYRRDPDLPEQCLNCCRRICPICDPIEVAT